MMTAPITLAGVDLWPTIEGALWWPAEATLMVADLHLEKGSSLARRGTLLPPYDSAATLALLSRLINRLAPRRVVCLGDSFHDAEAVDRLSADDAGLLHALARGRQWEWIAGNHDGAAGFAGLDGEVATEASLGPLVFRHRATVAARTGEVSGHFHPKARVAVAGRRIACRCFVGDGQRLILPAFGAYAGGLDVFDPAISTLLSPGFNVWLLGRVRIHRLSSRRLHRPRCVTVMR
ncbi:MAG: ligase-associated DNA damage response endonuclease PdeM [Rhodospirillales bacterium]|nr:ligase-associated DNA damage response endonuclease PdeM [Rhodospirillales bacterium]